MRAKTVTEHLRQRLYDRCGIHDGPQRHPPLPGFPPNVDMPPPDVLLKRGTLAHFWELMCNRMVLGQFRYGLNFQPGKAQYDRIADAHRRLDLYNQTGNLELLVDVANNCQLEFGEGKHPLRHFAAADDVGGHTEKL